MKMNLQKALLLIAVITSSAFADETTPGNWPAMPPDKEKLSYAFGMQTGMQAKGAGGDIDVKVFARAMKDVLEGKPSQLKESEIAALLNKGRTDGLTQQAEKNKEHVSYALGMRSALQIKSSGVEVNPDTIAQAIKDVLESKPTQIKESEIPALFEQARTYGLARISEKNKADGAAFLAKNAKEPGITVLPDGLQYRILQAGNGAIPTTNDLLIVKYRGSLIDGTEFGHKDQFITRVDGGIKGWQEALRLMKVGSKWQLFLPPDLAFGQAGEAYQHIGPNSTLIYDLELLTIPPPGAPLIGTGRMGHGLEGKVLSSGHEPGGVIQDAQTNPSANSGTSPKSQ